MTECLNIMKSQSNRAGAPATRHRLHHSPGVVPLCLDSAIHLEGGEELPGSYYKMTTQVALGFTFRVHRGRRVVVGDWMSGQGFVTSALLDGRQIGAKFSDER